MPKIITLSGVVGWDITANELRAELDGAGGEPVRIDINSPGGSVFDGIEMYNMIRNYEGETETRLVSLGASMGSIISLAGDKKTAEDTAVYMIHNPWSISMGDYRDFEKDAEMLKALADHLASLYAKETGIKKEEIRQMMDDETWFFGSEMAKFGFEILETEQEKDQETAVAVAKLDFEACLNRMEKDKKEQKSMDIAALIGAENRNPPRETGEENKLEVHNMDKAKLKAEFPDLYNELVEEGKASVNVAEAVETAVAEDRKRMQEIFSAAGIEGHAVECAMKGMDAGAWALDEKKKEQAARKGAESGIKGLKPQGQLPAEHAEEEKKTDPAQAKVDDAIDAIIGKKEAK